MAKPKVFVTRIIPDKGLDMVRDFCEVDLWTAELPPSRDELLKRVQGMDGILSLLTDHIDGEVMDTAGGQLKVISNFAVGYDNIDVSAATARKLPVGNTPDVLTDATADFAFTLMLGAGRRVLEGNRYVRDGKWLSVAAIEPAFCSASRATFTGSITSICVVGGVVATAAAAFRSRWARRA